LAVNAQKYVVNREAAATSLHRSCNWKGKGGKECREKGGRTYIFPNANVGRYDGNCSEDKRINSMRCHIHLSAAKAAANSDKRYFGFLVKSDKKKFFHETLGKEVFYEYF
jgi:hypothetical protein